MELSNLFKLVTKSGHQSLDVVKSAMQKYARRGMATEMLQAVSEMDAFQKFADSDTDTVQRTVKAIRTSMINRLKVILFEDVSFSQIGVFSMVAEKIKDWEDEDRTDKNMLAEIVSIIAGAKKLRLPSYLRAKYGKGESCSLCKDDFLNGIDNTNIKCVEWIYHNEKQALHMLESDEYKFEGKEHILPLITAEWKRLKPTKSKAGSNERFSFIVLPWLWIMYDNLNVDVNMAVLDRNTIKAAYRKDDVKFHDYVYDKTVVRAEEVVTNEDNVWLVYFLELKNYYNEQPEETAKRVYRPRGLTEEQKVKKAAKDAKPKRLRRGTVKNDCVKDIDINVDEIELMEGARAGKLPCGRARIKGVGVVIKPMTKGLNYGMDYIYIDKQKKLFGLKDLNIKLRKIPGKTLTLKCTEEQDEYGNTVKHKSYKWEDNEDGQVIAIMTDVNVKANLSKCKDLLKNQANYREMLKIRLFNGFFRTSDNTLSNILVDENDEMWAIDENDIYGRRKDVFNKKEHVKSSAFLTTELVESVIDELNFEAHQQTLIDGLSTFFPRASCEYYEREILERARNYKQIVYKELKFDELELSE